MTSKYFTDKLALDIPWVESPFFYELLKNSDLTEEQKQLCTQFHEEGYVTIDLDISDEEIQTVINEMYAALEDERTTFHADHFTYTPSKRIFEHWKKSLPIAKLTVHPSVMNALELLYARKPFPFSTINFIKGSNQPYHSDAVHFHTVPALWMAGVWVALEDVDETNGALRIIPGSHKWPVYEYQNLNLPHPDSIEDGEAVNYAEYERFLDALIATHNKPAKYVKLKKGQALIWAANMMHGGANVPGVTDLNRTRLTQANHYFFEGCEHYFHPMFSEPRHGKYATKWCSDTNNIKTYLESL